MVVKKAVFLKVLWKLRFALMRYDLLPSSARILVALSGGQDSLALSESLRHLHEKNPWRGLALAHCDHRWPHDEGNADLVQRYALASQLPLHIIDAQALATSTELTDAVGLRKKEDVCGDGKEMTTAVGMSEAAARDWRYEQLATLAQRDGFDYIVTAHTRTDLAETLLYNLVHGAGAEGLSSLTWSRPLCHSIRLVRPFLDISREDTAAFCREQNLNVWHDKYNLDERYARNRIRKHVMPLLKQTLNPQVEQAFARTAHLLRDDTMHLQREADTVFREAVVMQHQHASFPTANLDHYPHPLPLNQTRYDATAKNVTGEANTKQKYPTPTGRFAILCRNSLMRTGVAVQRRVIRRALRSCLGLSHKGATFVQVEAVRSLLEANIGAKSPSLCGHSSAFVADKDTIILKTPFQESEDTSVVDDDNDEDVNATANLKSLKSE